MENPVLLTTLEVIKKTKEVKINKDKVQEVARQWVATDLKVPDWPKEYHLKTRDEQKMLDYLIILDSVNFCFWNIKGRWAIDYKGHKYNGYYGWSLALKKFFEENPQKGSLEYLSKISFKEFKNILQGGRNLLLLKKRWQIIRAINSTIVEKYNNSKNFIESAGQKLSVLVPKIYKELPYFNDVSVYNGKKVYFLKRAQILCAEIWGAFNGKEIGEFQDLDYLTCFPDYKVPQALNHFGLIEYSQKLDRKIKNRILIPHNSKEEIEIRSATVWGVEYLKEALAKEGTQFRPFEVDWILWNKGREVNMEKSYHLTRTIFY